MNDHNSVVWYIKKNIDEFALYSIIIIIFNSKKNEKMHISIVVLHSDVQVFRPMNL